MRAWKQVLRRGGCAIALAVGIAPGVSAQSTEVTAARGAEAQATPGTVGLAGAFGRIKDKRNGFVGTTHWHQESLSGDVRVGRFWWGLTANHNESKKDLKAHTLSAGPNAGAQVAGGTSRTISNGLMLRGGTTIGAVNVGGFVGYDTGQTRELRRAGAVTATWRRDVTTRSFGAFASTVVDLGAGWYAIPTAQYLWLRTVSDATTDSLGQAVPEERDLLIRGLVGGEVGYQSFVADRVATLGVRPYLVHDFHQFRNFSDDSAMDVTAFFTLSGASIVTGIEITGTVGREEIHSTSGRLFVSLTF
ncbi:autotransporter outer membrane beta-barrel domain-containing protein [Nitrogeniibacter mangrovi]|uniref:Autotransporter outer membrane beta-barrel domain-containing protein n=1 Tax=Nitrogeniibacter mangrovi TaxID=2016596 RepID=A0A6C1B1J5_9RHOO|nr:hypothetical protein [Nitrogeniibacter mangrovi]QID17437.1 autotransporter outer membrane beta-barrel domain-containing protein [Nitrogeniibacter mangrovi]